MSRLILMVRWALAQTRRRPIRRGALALALSAGTAITAATFIGDEREAQTRARLENAAEELDALTDGGPSDDLRRAAVAWGYSERLRLGLESPFRLIEAAAGDVRLSAEERRTVSWALLAHVIRGETHDIEPAALDLIGPQERGRSVVGEQHLELMTAAIVGADNPRAAELALRLSYTLAAAERILDGAAPSIAAEAAAMIADREIARREGLAIVRASGSMDPIVALNRRRARRGLYVERPVMLAPDAEIERDAIAMAAALLDSIRALRPLEFEDHLAPESDAEGRRLAAELQRVAARVPPAAPLAVTVQRYLPVLRAYVSTLDHGALRKVINPEMLVATLRPANMSRAQRRIVGRLVLAAGVSMRSLAQEEVRFAPDSGISTATAAAAIGAASIDFDQDVPLYWQPYLLRSLTRGVDDLRRVLPALRLGAVHVRFRMTSPADSALAMHDPRTRTLHLPVTTAGGTLLHELAHELDRQSAQQEGLAGYRSDVEARGAGPRTRAGAAAGGRVAASLRALTEDVASITRESGTRTASERPAEIFATRVDWFVAQALARRGISNGFLTGVQDELLTGHVVHPERLRSSGRSRSLQDALEGMTVIAMRDRTDGPPTAWSLLRWSLGGPVDRRAAAEILRTATSPWDPSPLATGKRCAEIDPDGPAALIRLAADARARGWLRQRARWMSDAERPRWAHAMLGQAPWDGEAAEQRIAALRDHILTQLSSGVELPAGLGAYAAPIAAAARCH
jgi:hypothetical protein